MYPLGPYLLPIIVREKGNWQSLVSFMAGIRKNCNEVQANCSPLLIGLSWLHFTSCLLDTKIISIALLCFIQQLIGHSFYMLCWNCHMWIFSPWFFSIEYFGKLICINSISFLRQYTRFLAHVFFLVWQKWILTKTLNSRPKKLLIIDNFFSLFSTGPKSAQISYSVP